MGESALLNRHIEVSQIHLPSDFEGSDLGGRIPLQVLEFLAEPLPKPVDEPDAFYCLRRA